MNSRIEEKKLGKISDFKFGFVGYQDAHFGLSLSFEGEGWGCSTCITSGWNDSIKVNKNMSWSEDDRSNLKIQLVTKINKLLKDAKVQCITQLKNIPVELEFENQQIKDFRVLTEVL